MSREDKTWPREAKMERQGEVLTNTGGTEDFVICEIWIFSLLSCHYVSGTERQDTGRSTPGCVRAKSRYAITDTLLLQS